MRALNRKLLRDLWRLKTQLLAISLVMACGVGAFLMAVSASRSLQATQSAYYERAGFAHVFTTVKRAPRSLVSQVREIPGVVQVDDRAVAAVNLDIPGLNEPAAGLIVSIPDDAEPTLNRLHIRFGRLPESGQAGAGEVLVSEAFAAAHSMRPGFTFNAVINGRMERLTVVGAALSPEHVYSLRPGSFVPDDKRYGVMWMRRKQIEASFDLDGAFNDLALSISPEANIDEVKDRLDAITRPYGGDGAYGRDEQASDRYVSDELQQLRSMASVTPPVFLAVAAMLINIVISRLVRTQREQIALLRAFGYTPWDIGRHYFAMVAVVGIIGALVGIALGAYMGSLLTSLYVRFFRFPILEYQLEVSVAFIGVGTTLAAACGGAGFSVFRAMRLAPADAMRPEAPPVYHRSFVERFVLARMLSPAGRMVVRHLQRHSLRTAIAIFGVSMTVAILILGSFITDAVQRLIDLEFSAVQRQDITVTFNEPRAIGAQHELAAMPGIIAVEPFRTVPARITHGHRSRREALQGIVPDARLHRVLDGFGRSVDVPPDGLLISIALAELLDLTTGDEVDVEVLEGQRPTLRLRIERIVESFLGTAAYMDIAALNRVMAEGPTLNGAHLSVDRAAEPRLYSDLKLTPSIATVTIKRAALESFEETLAKNLLTMRMFNLAFACIITIGVVYNTARILQAERSHELATLRVLGFYRTEIAGIFLGELAVIVLVAIGPGLFAGYALAAAATAALQTETHRIPFAISVQTLAFAGTVVVLAAAATAQFVRSDLDDLDLVEVLKARA